MKHKNELIQNFLRLTTIEIFFNDMLGLSLEKISAEQTYVSDFFRFDLNRIDTPVNLRAKRSRKPCLLNVWISLEELLSV